MTIYYWELSLVVGIWLKSLVSPRFTQATLTQKDSCQSNRTLSEECLSPQILFNSPLSQWFLACFTFVLNSVRTGFRQSSVFREGRNQLCRAGTHGAAWHPQGSHAGSLGQWKRVIVTVSSPWPWAWVRSVSFFHVFLNVFSQSFIVFVVIKLVFFKNKIFLIGYSCRVVMWSTFVC